jgi:hypothetical protein
VIGHISIHEFLHLVHIENGRPMRVPLEVIPDDVMDDHFAVAEIRQTDGMRQRSVFVC